MTSLTDLPRELRDEIWKLCLRANDRIISPHHDALGVLLKSIDPVREGSVPSLFLVSRRIYRETKEIFFAVNTFILTESAMNVSSHPDRHVLLEPWRSNAYLMRYVIVYFSWAAVRGITPYHPPAQSQVLIRRAKPIEQVAAWSTMSSVLLQMPLRLLDVYMDHNIFTDWRRSQALVLDPRLLGPFVNRTVSHYDSCEAHHSANWIGLFLKTMYPDLAKCSKRPTTQRITISFPGGLTPNQKRMIHHIGFHCGTCKPRAAMTNEEVKRLKKRLTSSRVKSCAGTKASR